MQVKAILFSIFLVAIMMATTNCAQPKALSNNELFKRNVEVNMKEFVKRARNHPANHRSSRTQGCRADSCPRGVGDCSAPCTYCNSGTCE